MKIPHPDDPTFPKIRDDLAQKLIPKLLAHHKITPLWYQERFLFPPDPYNIHELKYVQLAGAKRIGKSQMLAHIMEAYVMIPGCQIRVYAPEYTLAERELAWLDKLLFTGPTALAKRYPWLLNNLKSKKLDPSTGNLEMIWQLGNLQTKILARSWERRNQWVGEPIDLAIMSEPGLFPDSKAYSRYIKPNLADRNATLFTGGTIDNPWMYEMHELAHDAKRWPDMCCTCEVARKENPYVWDQASQDRADPRKGGTETLHDFSINWLGQWGVFSEMAYERWNDMTVKSISTEKWTKAKQIPAGWDHWVAVDTGRYCSAVQFISNSRGDIVVIDEFSNYGYQPGGEIYLTDNRGFQPWFRDVMASITRFRSGMNLPIVIIDPSSQFKQDVENTGLGWVDAQNAHDYGVHVVNELIARKRLHILRPQDRPPYLLEREVPRVKWVQTASGIGGKHRLQKGTDDDHCADALRYGCAWRPIAEPITIEREPSLVEKDIQHLENELQSKLASFDEWGDTPPEDDLGHLGF